MKKNFLYLGIILMLLGVGIFFLSPGLTLPSQFTPVTRQFTVVPSASKFFPLQLNQSGLIILTYNSSTAVDFYFANATAFEPINAAVQGGMKPRSVAVGLEGNGVYEIYENSSAGAFPYTNYTNTPVPNYLLNFSLMQNGTYYGAFYNTGTEVANINVTILQVSVAKIQSSESSIGTEFLVAVIIFIAGLAIVVYSFISRDKKKEDDVMDADAAKQYAELDKKGKGKKKAS